MLNPLIDQWLADLHQADLLSEAGKHRPARSGRAAGDGLWERLVVGTGDLLIAAGEWLRGRYRPVVDGRSEACRAS
jgi:hypothetical protein